MKRILICLLALTMSLSMFACGNNNSAGNGNQVKNKETLPPDAPTTPPSYDWTNVFAATDLENPFRVRFVNTNPIACATGAVGHAVDDVVSFVDYNSIFAESDFGIDVSKATSADKIVETFESTFVKLVQYDVTAITTYGDPHIEVKNQENVKINDYDTCKSTGTYYYYPMFSKEGDKETELYFVSYATFLKDGTPVYVAAVDSSEDQSKKAQCDETAKKMIDTLEEVSKKEVLG